MHHAVGIIELTSIARGFEVADIMLKRADVELLMNRSICPGKYMVFIGGSSEAVAQSMEAGIRAADDSYVDSMVVNNIHGDILPAIAGTNELTDVDALGVVETFSVAAAVEAADASLKAADVRILQMHLAMAIGGKAYYTITGETEAVREAVNAAADYIRTKGLLVNKVVIPQPRREIVIDKV